jgi:hypothetical protein
MQLNTSEFYQKAAERQINKMMSEVYKEYNKSKTGS